MYFMFHENGLKVIKGWIAAASMNGGESSLLRCVHSYCEQQSSVASSVSTYPSNRFSVTLYTVSIRPVLMTDEMNEPVDINI